MMNNNCQELNFTVESLLLLCHKPFYFCLHTTSLLINFSNKRHINMNCRTFQVKSCFGHVRFYLSVQFSSVQFSSVQFSSVQFSSVQFSSVQFSSVQFSSVQFSSVQFSSVQFSSVQFSSVQFSSVQFSSVQFSSVQFSSVQFSSVQFSSVQFSSVQFSYFTSLTNYSYAFFSERLIQFYVGCNRFNKSEINEVRIEWAL